MTAPRGLIRRVVIALVVIVGGSAAISALVSATIGRRLVREVAGLETLSFGEVLAYEITRNYELTDERGLSGFIDGIRRRRPELLTMRVVDSAGRVVASSEEGEVGKPLDDTRLPSSLAGETTAARPSGRDGEAASVLLPLRIGKSKVVGVLALEQSHERLQSALVASRNLNLALAMITSLLAAAGLGWFFDRRVVRPITSLAASARRVAARDLTQTLARGPAHDGKDELADLLVAFTEVGQTSLDLVTRLERLAGTLRGAGESVGSAARVVQSGAAEQRKLAVSARQQIEENIKLLDDLGRAASTAVGRADEGGRAARDIATAATELVRVAVTAGTDVTESVRAIEQVATSLATIRGAVDEARTANHASSSQARIVHTASGQVRVDALATASLAGELAGEAGRGAEAVTRALERIREVDERIRAVSAHVEVLNPALERILGIASIVGDIARETGVLSLNAGILAAHAGEAGMGFRVVADRIRVLSSQTHSSASDISTLVRSIETTAPAVLESVRASRATVTDGVRTTEEAAVALSRILRAASAARDSTARIASAAVDQASAAEHLLSSTAQAAARVDELTEAAEQQRVGTQRLEQTGAGLREAARAVESHARRQEVLAAGISNGARSDATRLRELGAAAVQGVQSGRALQQTGAQIVEVGARHATALERFDEVLSSLATETAELGATVATFRLPGERPRDE